MKLTARELTVFSMLGTILYVSKLAMEGLPNIHLVGVLIVSYTVVYRKKALYPIYVYVFLIGLMNGFNTWWLPYLYIWTVLWGLVMILPKNMPRKIAGIVYLLICGLHGLFYGVLYAPMQAIIYGLSMEETIAWIMAGLPFDLTHGISNFFGGLLIMPIVSVLRLAEKNMHNDY